MDDDNILLAIACKGFSRQTSTIKLSEELGLSQQSVSRKLIEMEKSGLITREASPRGMNLAITPVGRKLLRKKYLKLLAVLEGCMKISGKVVSSLGEGSYYLKQKGYIDQIQKKLGFKPYPGTLNIKTREFPITTPIKIDGFKTKERSFGSLECYPIKIKNISCAIVVPTRTHHKEILEIIAPVSLRKELHLKDGDKIELEVEK